MSANRDLVSELEDFVERFPTYDQTTDRIPAKLDAEVREAVQAKRDGDYRLSVKLYAALTERVGVLYTGMLVSLYKTVAVSGHLREAAVLLGLAEEIYQRDPANLPPDMTGLNVASDFEDHFHRLSSAVTSEPALVAYLTPLSGSATYEFPRDYSRAAAEFAEMIAQLEAGD